MVNPKRGCHRCPKCFDLRKNILSFAILRSFKKQRNSDGWLSVWSPFIAAWDMEMTEVQLQLSYPVALATKPTQLINALYLLSKSSTSKAKLTYFRVTTPWNLSSNSVSPDYKLCSLCYTWKLSRVILSLCAWRKMSQKCFPDSHPFQHSITLSYGENSLPEPQVQAVYLVPYTKTPYSGRNL